MLREAALCLLADGEEGMTQKALLASISSPCLAVSPSFLEERGPEVHG